MAGAWGWKTITGLARYTNSIRKKTGQRNARTTNVARTKNTLAKSVMARITARTKNTLAKSVMARITARTKNTLAKSVMARIRTIRPDAYVWCTTKHRN